MDNIDTLCFSSGALHGFSFMSALNYLCENKYIDLNNINKYVGTSAGSMVSFCLIIGYTPKELIDIFIDYDFKKLEPELNLDNIITCFGFDDCTIIISVLKNLCKDKLNVDNITLYDLYKLTNKIFILNTTNFNKGTELIMSYETTPDLSVFDAIRMSITIPLLHTPFIYNNEYYYDGSLSNNILLSECNPNTTFCFYINSKTSYELNSIQDVFIGCIQILASRQSVNFDNYKILRIDPAPVSSMSVEITKEMMINIFNAGVDASEIFYMNELKQKINKIKTNIEMKTRNISMNIIDEIINKIIDKHV